MSRYTGNNGEKPKRWQTFGARTLGQLGEQRSEPEHVHIPDEEHVQVCLNCTRKKCTGYCNKVRSYGKRHKGEDET